MPGDVTLWPGITGGEVIDLMGRLRGGIDRRRRDDLLERFDLDPRKRAST
jgi:ABC-2 type transport system ATP-binding protein